MPLSREQFFAVVPFKSEDVPIPGTSETIRIRELSVKDRLDLEAATKDRPAAEVVTRFIVASAVDAAGSPLFEPGDVDGLMGLPTAVLETLFDAVDRVNGLSAKAVEEEGKD